MHDFGKLDLVNIFPSKKSLKNSSFTVGKDVSSHDVSVVGKDINGFLRDKKGTPSTRLRKKIAERLNNHRILKISFKTLCRFRGTMESHKTKNILHVKRALSIKILKTRLFTLTWNLLSSKPLTRSFMFKQLRR